MSPGSILGPTRPSQIALWRFLDVASDRWRLLAILPVIAALFAAAAGLLTNHSHSVSTRIWADVPAGSGAGMGLVADSGTPADTVVAVLGELLGTDWFTGNVLSGVSPDFKNQSRLRQRDDELRLRRSVHLSADGPHVVTITTAAASDSEGERTLTSLVSSFTAAIESMQVTRSSALGGSASAQLGLAKAAADDAVSQLQDYLRSMPTGITAEERQQDPIYQTLMVQVANTAQRYESLLSVAQEAQLSGAGATGPATMFRVIDSPGPNPDPITLRTPFVRLALAAAGTVLVAEALIVYLLARRDPRIRTGLEVEAACNVGYVGAISSSEAA